VNLAVVVLLLGRSVAVRCGNCSRRTSIGDGNWRFGAVVVVVLRLVARRQVMQIGLITRFVVVIAQPQIDIQLCLHCPSTLALALLSRFLFVSQHA